MTEKEFFCEEVTTTVATCGNALRVTIPKKWVKLVVEPPKRDAFDWLLGHSYINRRYFSSKVKMFRIGLGDETILIVAKKDKTLEDTLRLILEFIKVARSEVKI